MRITKALMAILLVVAAGISVAQDKEPKSKATMGVEPPDLSLPMDCVAISDELARIEKFSHNPQATPKQLAANAARAEKLKDKLEDLRADSKCPPAPAATAPAAPATPAPAAAPAKKK